MRGKGKKFHFALSLEGIAVQWRMLRLTIIRKLYAILPEIL
jgi:hypothetical protein